MLRRGSPSRGFPLKLLFALVLFVVPVAVLAENIYKYQDENGIWHFTDRKPEEKQKFETVYMEKEPEPRISMRTEGPDTNPVYVLFNDFWGPVEVELQMTEAVNVLTEPSLPARFVIPGQSERSLLGVGALDPKRGFRFRLQMESVPGAPVTEPVADLVLHPPWRASESFPISQGFGGTRTHLGPDSEFAIDVVMPVGTDVLAARDGVVMDVEEDFNRGGANLEEFADKANHVRILHADGTMAVYAHLDLASVTVRRGGRVRAGQKIASSGNTGFSTGPHLHFVVQQNIGMKLQSLPFRFHLPGGETGIPSEQQLVSGTLPGN